MCWIPVGCLKWRLIQVPSPSTTFHTSNACRRRVIHWLGCLFRSRGPSSRTCDFLGSSVSSKGMRIYQIPYGNSLIFLVLWLMDWILYILYPLESRTAILLGPKRKFRTTERPSRGPLQRCRFCLRMSIPWGPLKKRSTR